MMPTVAQQLSGIRNAMTKVVIPGLDPGDPFAQEQAGLIVATLSWILDVQASEYTYEAIENAQYRTLAEKLAAVTADPERAGALRSAAAEAGGVPAELPTLEALREQTRRFKALIDATYSALGDGAFGDGALGADTGSAKELLLEAARAQTRREQSWFRMTGFPKNVEGDIATVLAGTGP